MLYVYLQVFIMLITIGDSKYLWVIQVPNDITKAATAVMFDIINSPSSIYLCDNDNTCADLNLDTAPTDVLTDKIIFTLPVYSNPGTSIHVCYIMNASDDQNNIYIISYNSNGAPGSPIPNILANNPVPLITNTNFIPPSSGTLQRTIETAPSIASSPPKSSNTLEITLLVIFGIVLLIVVIIIAAVLIYFSIKQSKYNYNEY